MRQMPKTKSKFDIPIEGTTLPRHPVLVTQFGYCFMKSALRMRKMLSEELSSLGVIPPQMGLMAILSKTGPMNQIRLGEEMAIDKATMVKLLDGLENDGFIRRKPDAGDRRVKLVELTTKGLQLLPKLMKARERVEKEFLKPLSASELKSFQKLVKKLL